MESNNHRVQQLAMAYQRVARRAELFAWPIREMQARGWIHDTNDTTEIEDELCRFFGCSRFEEIERRVEEFRSGRLLLRG